jgi:RimJ/RimL family protein N-acetyltransferase
MGVLPERIDVTGLVLRRWTVADAAAQQRAVAENIEHLRPWMPWMAEEPQPLKRRRELIARWDREWAEGGDSVLGVFLDGAVAGSCGLHRRAGPETLEIGYWIHRSFLRRGLATRVATMLTGAALSVPGIEAVEIHHDKANEISARVPRRLGYRLVEERRVAPRAPAEIGVKCVWRIECRGLADHDRGYRPERTR